MNQGTGSGRGVAAGLETMAVASGVCALGYEVLYIRTLTTALGDALWVHAALLSTFLIGTAVGARVAHRAHRWLAAFEVVIGVYALLFPLMTAWVVSAGALGGVASPVGASLATMALVAFPAFAIGFSLPLFSAYVKAVRHEAGATAGAAFPNIYGLYNFGAAVGVVLIELLLLRAVGVTWSLRLLGGANLLIGLALFAIGGTQHRRPQAPAVLASGRLRLALFAVSVASGVFQMAFLKSLYLTFSPHRENFAVGLAVVLFGITAGTAVVSRSRLRFSSVVLAAGVTASAGYLLLPGVWALHGALSTGLGSGAIGGLLARLIAASALGLLPLMCFGATVPALLGREGAVAEESGALLWLAGIGNAVGYLAFIGVLHPLLPMGGLIGLLTVVCWGAAALAEGGRDEGRERGRDGGRSRARIASAVAVAAAVLLAGSWDEGAFQLGRYAESSRGSEVRVFRWWGESATLVRSPGEDWVSYNGHPSIHARRNGVVNLAELVSGVVPSLVAPRTGRAAVLGLGTGLTAGAAARAFAQVDVVEINGAFVALAADLKDANLDVLGRDNVRLTIGDGRTFLSAREGEYDAIVNSIPAPTYYAASKIYTLEFYRAVRRALAEDGVFVTWLAPNDMTARGLDTVLRTLSEVFATCDLWLLRRGYYMTACSAGQLALSARPVDVEHFDADRTRVMEQALGAIRVDEHFDAVRLSSDLFGKLVSDWGASARVNTDDRPVLEFLVTSGDEGARYDPIVSNPTRYGIEPWAIDKLGLERIASRAASIGRIDPLMRDHLLKRASAAEPDLYAKLDSLWAHR